MNMEKYWDTDNVLVLAKSDEDVTQFAIDWLVLQGYDVPECQPEIAPCPYCGDECYTWNPTWNPEEDAWSVACTGCTYNSGDCDSDIRKHNRIAGR